MIFKAIHLLIVAVYVLCPIVALIHVSVARAKHRLHRPMLRFRLTALLGLGVGTLACVIYAAAMHGRLVLTQVLLTSYFATSLMLLLQGCDRVLWNLSRRVFRLDQQRGSLWWYNLRAILGLTIRAVLVFCVGLPYVLATVLTYRPRVATVEDPSTLYQWNFERVAFASTDGLPISGWWIPSSTGESQKTVVFCPGSNADKATQLALVHRLVPDGYNVLVFDFRAHGESGGQLCSFGDLERNDVLGALGWLKKYHPDACKKVAGLGVSTGAAALLAAAADSSPEGQNIDAIAVYCTYDRLDNEVAALTKQFVPGPLGWFVNHLGLPMASFQVGTDLSAFSPASQIKAIWPRPVLVIHGIDDQFVPFDEGQALYDSALEPKMNFWINRCGHAAAINNEAAAKLVRRCFDAAVRVI